MLSPDKCLQGNHILSIQQINTLLYILSNKAYIILSYLNIVYEMNTEVNTLLHSCFTVCRVSKTLAKQMMRHMPFLVLILMSGKRSFVTKYHYYTTSMYAAFQNVKITHATSYFNVYQVHFYFVVFWSSAECKCKYEFKIKYCCNLICTALLKKSKSN